MNIYYFKNSNVKKRDNVIKRNKMRLKRIFFNGLDKDRSFVPVIGVFKKAYYYFIDVIYPSFNISFEDFAMVIVELGIYPVYNKRILPRMLQRYKDFEEGADKAGIIMLDPSCKFVLLLESHSFDANWLNEGWWGFPKEKKEPLVSFAECAKQEALEETGRKVKIDKTNPLVGNLSKNRVMKLFFTYNWPIDSEFLPQTSNEIKSSAWFRISYLDETPSSVLQQTMQPSAVKRIKMFIRDIRARSNQRILANLAKPDMRLQSEVAFVNKKEFPF